MLQGLKPAPVLRGFCGTTEVVLFHDGFKLRRYPTAIYMGVAARDISSMYWSFRSSAGGSQLRWAQNFSPVR